VHTESVAFVSGRTDLLACFFVLLSAICWVVSRRGSVRRALRVTVAGGLFFALACLAKETAIVLPVALLLWDTADGTIAGSDSPGWLKRNRGWLLAWGAALAVVLALRLGMAGIPLGARGEGAGFRHSIPLLSMPSLIPLMWLDYFRLLLIPWPLQAYYTAAQMGSGVSVAAGSAAVLGLILAAVGGSSRRAGLLGLSWIAVFLIPVSGLVPLRGAIIAERFLYLPSVGMALTAGFLLARLARRASTKWLAWALAALLAAAGASLCVKREAVWQDSLSLSLDLVKSLPGLAPSHFFD
jgi:hypothetical protein